MLLVLCVYQCAQRTTAACEQAAAADAAGNYLMGSNRNSRSRKVRSGALHFRSGGGGGGGGVDYSQQYRPGALRVT